MIVKVLTNEQINQIHQSSLKILEKMGVIIPHDKILSEFDLNGANVDFNEKRVRIPSELVMELVSKAGKEFTLYGRDLSKKAEFGNGKRNYNSTAGQAFWLDKIGEDRRYSTMKDVITAIKFADALDQITIPGAMSDPHELPVSWRCVAIAYEAIKNTTKPITFWFYDRASAKYIVDLLIKLRGDENKAMRYPMFYPLLEPVSPLTFPFNGVDLLFETARLNMPVAIGPMAQMGLSAPSTITGIMTQENAEILASICITQLIRKGLPICYGGICHAFDMRKVQIIFSGPEQAIFNVAMTQMGKFYGFPVYINAGLTDSKSIDAQAGLECGITLSHGIAAGADIFGHMGICGVDQASSLDILVMQSEIISFIESINRSFSFEEDDFALDLIEKVGPKGTFIDKKHTRDHFKRELWFPTLLDRNYYKKWKENGARSMEHRCCDRKNEILASHEPEPLEADIENELKKIVEKSKKNL
ncbi:MAG: trimethylamine methyltransferase family protein [Candidatus Hermodarchaeota archaeon]